MILRAPRTFAAAAAAALVVVSAAGAAEKAKIPRPTDKLAPVPPPPAVEASSLSLPVTISVNALAAAVEKSFPAEKREEQKWVDGAELVSRPGFQFHYMLWRGTPELKAAGDTLQITFPEAKFRIRGRLSPEGPIGTCGYKPEPLRRMVVKASAKLSLAADGTIQSKTSFDPPQLPDPCTLKDLDVDAAPVLKKALEARLPAMTQALDAAIRAQSVSRRRLAGLWQKLQQPKELRPGLWLVLSPSSLALSPLSSDGEKAFKTSLSVDIAPRAEKGGRPAVKQASLPRLGSGAAKPSVCHLALPIRISYGEMNGRLRKDVVGTDFDAGPLGTIKVVSTNLYGSGDRLVMEVGVSGGVNGKIYAIGKPVLDTSALMIKIEDLDLTIETKNLFAKAANSMGKDKLIASLEPATRVELKAPLENLRRELVNRFRQETLPGVWLEVSDVKVTPRGVYPAPGGIEVQAVVDGSLKLVAR